MLSVLLVTGGCSALRTDRPATPSFALADGERTSLGRVFEAEAALRPGLSGFHLVVTGREAFATRVALADLSERTLDLQYYSAADDFSANLILQRIVDAAHRGVRVRVLLDDIHPASRRFAYRASAAHPALEVRMFNPFYWSDTWDPARVAELFFHGAQLNRRMHNKLWIADNAAAIVGSRNLGDVYFDALDAGNFSDVDLLAAGPIVRELSRSFDAYWNSAAAVPIENFAPRTPAAESERVRQSLLSRVACANDATWCQGLDRGFTQGGADVWRSKLGALVWAGAGLVYDPPEEEKSAVASGIEHGWIEDRTGGARTQTELLIVSPYLVLGDDGLNHLADMYRRGVRVAVLTNSLSSTDSLAAHAGYARQRAALLRSGVELFEVRLQAEPGHRQPHRWLQATSSSLHAKVVVQDRERAIVGSLNQDPRSRLHNTETWLTIDTPLLAAELAALFDEGTDSHHAFRVELKEVAGVETLHWRTEEQGNTVVYNVEPAVGAWHRFWRAVLGALIPEELL